MCVCIYFFSKAVTREIQIPIEFYVIKFLVFNKFWKEMHKRLHLMYIVQWLNYKLNGYPDEIEGKEIVVWSLFYRMVDFQKYFFAYYMNTAKIEWSLRWKMNLKILSSRYKKQPAKTWIISYFYPWVKKTCVKAKACFCTLQHTQSHNPHILDCILL